jgi:uncharacterized membrane protein YheB (UPF0754 family)
MMSTAMQTAIAALVAAVTEQAEEAVQKAVQGKTVAQSIQEAAEESIQGCIDNGGLDDTISEAVEKQVESVVEDAVSDAVDNAAEKAVEAAWDDKEREITHTIEESVESALTDAGVEETKDLVGDLRDTVLNMEQKLAAMEQYAPLFSLLTTMINEAVEKRVAEALVTMGGPKADADAELGRPHADRAAASEPACCLDAIKEDCKRTPTPEGEDSAGCA